MDQVIQVAGALLILVAFAAAQFGWMSLESRVYLTLNLLGGTFNTGDGVVVARGNAGNAATANFVIGGTTGKFVAGLVAAAHQIPKLEFPLDAEEARRQ